MVRSTAEGRDREREKKQDPDGEGKRDHRNTQMHIK